MADQKRINGNDVSFGSIRAVIDGERYFGFTEVGYGDKRTRTYGYGMTKDQAPRSKSRGKYEPDPCTLKGPKSSMQALRSALQAKAASEGETSYGDVEFDIQVQYIEGGQVHNDEVLGCTVSSMSETHTEGDEILEMEAEFMPRKIVRDGTTLFSR